jgi:hypothetical protein
LKDGIKAVKWLDPVVQIASRVGPSLGPTGKERWQIGKANGRDFIDEV